MILCHSWLRFLGCNFAVGARLKLAARGFSKRFGLAAVAVDYSAKVKSKTASGREGIAAILLQEFVSCARKACFVSAGEPWDAKVRYSLYCSSLVADSVSWSASEARFGGALKEVKML